MELRHTTRDSHKLYTELYLELQKGRASANHRNAVVKGANDNWPALLPGNTNDLPSGLFLC
jgi:hypothetical protein